MRDTAEAYKMTSVTGKTYTNSDLFRQKIHSLIPGGAHTYSKGDDQFPEIAPAAISHGKGAWVWDIDGNKFLDCSMGLTSVSLGHAFEPILTDVKEELDKGVNFQRPSYIELEMAEEFLSLVPQHQMIKFAKNGSTVTTAAVKLSRAFTNRKLVAFPSDHPFYSYDDWFIGKTECDSGIPEELASLSITFKANDIHSLTDLFQRYTNQIACVITEPEKNFESASPETFLKEAIDLSHQNGALFIIDEMITGFKTAFPGSIIKYGLTPDLATWGKGIANGFSFCALTGTKEVMDLGGINRPGKEKLFLISTTHGGETHAVRAGLATIKFFKENDVVAKNLKSGNYVIEKSRDILRRAGLEKYVIISETAWMVVFVFKNLDEKIDNWYRTLAMQEMIDRGVLFQGIFVPCYSHDIYELDFFLAAFEETVVVYKEALHQGIHNFLRGEATKPVFRKIL